MLVESSAPAVTGTSSSSPTSATAMPTLTGRNKEGRAAIQWWCDNDPNLKTAEYVQSLLSKVEQEEEGEEAAFLELSRLFPADVNQRIGFGTAGLRSAMEPGPLGMNDLVVLQTAQGLAKYCLEQPPRQKDRDTKLCAVVGYDHRSNSLLQLSSLSFALLTAIVFMEAGIDCLLLDGIVATPMVPFCLSQIPNAAVGVMITASHNPKQDAGYKVYWRDGCQIRAPLDKGIASSILQNLKPWIDYRRRLQQLARKSPEDPCLGLSQPGRTKEMIDAYFQTIEKSGLVTGQQAKFPTSPSCKPPSFAYSAMHGVGHRFAKQSFQSFGLDSFLSVPAQQDPDPSFPTVPFPNPEERGALTLAKSFAEEHGCDIVLANDPDADRLAVAERDRENGQWTVFTGDQIGTMLGHWLWEQIGQSSDRPIAMCASTASSKMLAEIARVEGFHFEDTLTGFKWIGSRAASLNKEGYRSIFCYEEAIGFCCGDVIFDKDGVSAVSVFAELALSVYGRQSNLRQHMQSLYDKYGEFVSNNGYFFLSEPSVVPVIMDHITNKGVFDTLDNVGSYKVESFRYLGEPGYDSSTADKTPVLPTSKTSPMMTIRFVNGCVAQFRASGTEPKFKYYIELKGKPGVSRQTVEHDLMQMSDVILEALLQPDKHGLIKP